MDTTFIKGFIVLLAIGIIPIAMILFTSIVCSICLSLAIYIKVILTLIQDSFTLLKNKNINYIPKI